MANLENMISKVISEIDEAESSNLNSPLNATGLKILLSKYSCYEFNEVIARIEKHERDNPYAQINSSGVKVFLNELLKD